MPTPADHPELDESALEPDESAAGAGEASEEADNPARAGRARPLPPAERRAALVAATVPLVEQFGRKVTTRQIAEAAGVAEGTIFRVFPYKEKLVQVAISSILDPAPMLAELESIDLTLPLEERLVALTTILQQRLTRVFGLLLATGVHGPPEDMVEHRRSVQPTNEAILAAVVRLLEPDSERLAYPVGEVAHLLRLLTFAGSHPRISDRRPLSARQIVAVVLDGVRRHDREDGDSQRAVSLVDLSDLCGGLPGRFNPSSPSSPSGSIDQPGRDNQSDPSDPSGPSDRQGRDGPSDPPGTSDSSDQSSTSHTGKR